MIRICGSAPPTACGARATGAPARRSSGAGRARRPPAPRPPPGAARHRPDHLVHALREAARRVVAALLQELVARGHLHQDGDVAARAPPACG